MHRERSDQSSTIETTFSMKILLIFFYLRGFRLQGINKPIGKRRGTGEASSQHETSQLGCNKFQFSFGNMQSFIFHKVTLITPDVVHVV